MGKKRQDQDPPLAVEKWGWKYHHLGIPTTKSLSDERYIPHLKMYVAGFESNPFGIEWIRFEEDASVSELVRTLPHIAFEVEDLDKALRERSFEIISPPQVPSQGVRAAMIKYNEALVELIEFNKKGNKNSWLTI
jgi:hypothetical protein